MKSEAMEAAKELSADDLKKILDEKSASPEDEEVSAIQAILAEAEKLPGEKLSQFVQNYKTALLQLEILNIKRNVTSLTLSTQELDGILLVLDKLPREQKIDLTSRMQQAAMAAGLPQGNPLNTFAQKLARLGLHL